MPKSTGRLLKNMQSLPLYALSRGVTNAGCHRGMLKAAIQRFLTYHT